MVKGCGVVYRLTTSVICRLFVTPVDVVQQTTVRMDQFSLLVLNHRLLSVSPGLRDRELMLGIFYAAVEHQVKGVFQRDLNI